MRFTKEGIRLLIGYFDLKSIEYRDRLRPSPKSTSNLLLCEPLWLRLSFELTQSLRRSPSYLSIVLNNIQKYLRLPYEPMLA